jgi:hypothetical protein
MAKRVIAKEGRMDRNFAAEYRVRKQREDQMAESARGIAERKQDWYRQQYPEKFGSW